MSRRSSYLQVFVSLAAALAVLLPFVAFSSSEEAAISWDDTARDVVVDGEPEPGAVVLTTGGEDQPPRLAILSRRLDAAYVVDLDSLAVGTLPLDAFAFDGGGASTAAAAEPESIGRATQVRDGSSTHLLLSAGGHTLLVSPHQGSSGPMALAELFDSAPTWRLRADAYEPDADAVTALKAYDRDAEVTVALGTWCGDSRNYVPRLLRALEVADNPRLRLQLVSIHRGFDEPAELIREERLTNVPTVIVREAGEEIGRIVETPASETVEGDLAAILGGAAPPHHGRWQRDEEIARGSYAYVGDGDARVGGESWELFRTEDGGSLLHSTGERGGKSVEIWHRRGEDGASEFAELTCRDGEALSRTRIWIDEDGGLRSVTRGNVTGIVDQSLEVPPGTRLLLPCAAASDPAWIAGETGAESTRAVFFVPWDQPAAGRLVELSSRALGREDVRVEDGEASAERVETRVGGETSEWWLDGELGLPLRATLSGLGRVESDEFVRAAAPGDPDGDATAGR
jgi:hypothetical protein